VGSIGIFRAKSGDLFFGADNVALVEALYDEAETALGNAMKADPADDGAPVQRVGEITLDARAVFDPDLYELTRKVTVDRTPDAAPGSRIVQTIIFDASKFTPEQARAWLSAHKKYGDYGMDQRGNGLRFRQYNPSDFLAGTMRTAEITDGVIAVTGEVAGAPTEASEESDGAKDAKATTKRIADGLRLLNDTAHVRKAEDGTEERYVLSLVLEPNDGESGPLKPDTQGDIYSADDIRKAAHNWMEHHGKSDLEHSWESLGKSKVRILESYLAPCDFELSGYNIVKGTWMLALRIADDELWKAVKEGEIGAYSIGGTAMREPVEQEAPE
jgi:hypothetical protein